MVMKMNLKLGNINGVPTDLDTTPLIDATSRIPYMVLGSDVTHYLKSGERSIASLVGSFDSSFAQFPGN